MNKSTSFGSYYIRLQYRRSLRLLKDNGISLWIAVPLVSLVFIFLSFRLLGGYPFGELIYAGIAFSCSTSMIDTRRSDFIRSISTPSQYRWIRVLEQLIILIPFILGLALFQWYSFAIIVLSAGVCSSFIDANFSLPRTTPTPFGSRPFEFSRGFRGTILIILGCYALVPIGMSVDNFNLAISSIVGIGLVSGNYFMTPEPRFYVWIHSMSSQQLLIEKSKTIFFYLSIYCLPIATMLWVYDPSRLLSIILILVASLAFTLMCMLAKYVAYPSELNIVAGFAMGFSILFPPLMLAIIPIFYFKAKQRLDLYLR